ncbi:MAG: PaaI family thioesterase [Bacteroidota bacterium]
MSIEELNKICKGTFIDLLKIEFTGYSATTVEATMTITPDLYQPMGVVHGGALISLAETVGSAGSLLLVDPEQYDVFGSVVNSQHITPASKGSLYAIASLVVKAEFKHVWDVEIKDEKGKLISISRVTNSVKPRKQEAAR